MHDSDFSSAFPPGHLSQAGRREDNARLLRSRYTGGGDFDEEPVYNTDSAWDRRLADHPRSTTLAPRIPSSLPHYAKLDPQRAIYQYDRATLALERLGTAAELAERFPLKPRD